jgi:HD-GYP domain-containing protein (c-di-GMP phosphodiesterase class II)
MHAARVHYLDLYRHSLLVGELAAVFGAFLGLSPPACSLLVKSALLHDVGKVRLSRELLSKPAALTPSETLEMQSHPELGYLLLTEEGGYEPEVLAVVQQHHERLNGSGYPRGLLGTDISEPVRIVMLCDIYAAMTEERPYAKSYTSREALQLMTMKKTRLDLRLMRHFASMVTTVLSPRR